MSDLVVVAFENETDAEKLQAEMKRLQKEHRLTLEDAAIVVRKVDGKVRVKQSTSLVGAGALGGGLLGPADRPAVPGNVVGPCDRHRAWRHRRQVQGHRDR